jgi:hypothetical protein
VTSCEHRSSNWGVPSTHATSGIFHVPVKSYVRSLEAKIPYKIPMTGGIVDEVNFQFSNWTNLKNLRE